MASEFDSDLFAGALSLPVHDRARLAHVLLLSLEEPEAPGSSEEWLEEIERRANEVRAGLVSLEDWTAVRSRLSDRWSRR